MKYSSGRLVAIHVATDAALALQRMRYRLTSDNYRETTDFLLPKTIV